MNAAARRSAYFASAFGTSCVLALSGIGAALPSAAAPSKVVAPAPVLTVDQVALNGAIEVTGLSETEASKLLEGQRTFGLVVNEIRDKYPNSVSYLRWNWALKRGEIQLVNHASDADKTAIRAIASRAGADVSAGGAFGHDELAGQAATLAGEIRRIHPDVLDLSVHPNATYSGLEVTAPLDVSDVTAKWESSSSGNATVALTVVPGMTGHASGGVVGGAQLNLPGGAADCTSAFTISIAGVHYLLTAGHCQDADRYGNNPWLAWIADHTGTYGDLQYHRVYNGGVALPQFQYQTGALTTNRYPSWPFINQLVNRYGRLTSETRVIADDDSTEVIAGVPLTHVSVTDYDTNQQGTDSGGPFWVGASGGASAVGILYGAIWLPPGTFHKRAVFTPAGNLWNIWPNASYYTA